MKISKFYTRDNVIEHVLAQGSCRLHLRCTGQTRSKAMAAIALAMNMPESKIELSNYLMYLDPKCELNTIEAYIKDAIIKLELKHFELLEHQLVYLPYHDEDTISTWSDEGVFNE